MLISEIPIYCINLQERPERKQNAIQELEKIRFNLARKVNANPVLPYINFEKTMVEFPLKLNQLLLRRVEC